jgi:hypothetical protein
MLLSSQSRSLGGFAFLVLTSNLAERSGDSQDDIGFQKQENDRS